MFVALAICSVSHLCMHVTFNVYACCSFSLNILGLPRFGLDNMLELPSGYVL